MLDEEETRITTPGDVYTFQQAFLRTEELPHFHVVLLVPERTPEEGQVLWYTGPGEAGNHMFSPDHKVARVFDLKRAVRFARFMSRKDGPYFAAVAHTDPGFPEPAATVATDCTAT